MFKKILFLFCISSLSYSGIIKAMEEASSEQEPANISSLPIELVHYTFETALKNIVDESKDIFEAQTKLTESNLIKNIILVSKSFKSSLSQIRGNFIRLLNEKFPNPFLGKSIEEINQFLAELFVDLEKKEDDLQNELLAGQAILAGADVNLKMGRNRATPLLMASIISGYSKFAKFLIERGADVNEANKQGYTPLMMATKENYPNIVEILLEYGADPNKSDNSRLTPLMLATFYNNSEIVQQLLNHEADPRAVDVDGDTALKIAKRRNNKEIKKLLKNALAKNKARKCIIA